jgi:purine nucleosidase
MKHRIVLDTDMGTDVDDALCLALALAAPEIELMAVTHVSRDTRFRMAITRRLLELGGRAEIPAFAGCEEPLTGGDTFAWFGHEGKGVVEREHEAAPGGEHAVDALLRLFRAAAGLELVAVGPLTNVAAALTRDPSFASRIAMLTVMGGHLRSAAYGGANLPPSVDYNLCSDAKAAALVFAAGIPTRLVTADVTLQTWLREADVGRLEASASDFQRTLARAIRHWTPVQNRIFSNLGADMTGDNVAFLHDPLALASVYDESFCRFEELAIEPRIEGGTFRSMERIRPGSGSFPMRCATALDAERFRAHFMERITAL